MTELARFIHPLSLPTPFPVGPVNVYLVEGEPLTLVDVGPRMSRSWAALEEGLARHGYTPADVQQVVITHTHSDHLGNLARLVEVSGAQVLAHRRNRDWITDFPTEWVRRVAYYVECMQRGGAPREQVTLVREMLAPGIRLGASVPEEHLRLVDEGDAVVMGGVEWQVYHTPGHASGHIVLHQPEAKLLLAGDHLLVKVSSNPVLESPLRGEAQRPRSLVDYMASLRKTAELDVRRVLTGHGPPVEDHRALVEQRLAMHRERLERIRTFLADGPRTPYQVCRALFPNLADHDVFLAMSEVIAHLDVLEAEGDVVHWEREGWVWYEVKDGG